MRVFGVLCIVGLLLFTKLGHYALWDDEANTALTGKAIIKTGDTSASVDGRNFLMYRQGTELKEFKNRYLPPLSSCLAALSFLFFEPSACSARLPFAVIGFMGIAFFLILIWRLNIPSPFLIVFVILLLSNVSLYLFLRIVGIILPSKHLRFLLLLSIWENPDRECNYLDFPSLDFFSQRHSI